MPPSQEDLQSDTIAESWRLMHEALTTGSVTLRSGLIKTPKTGELLRLAQYAANLKPPRMRRVPDFDQYAPAVTQRAKSTEAQPAQG